MLDETNNLLKNINKIHTTEMGAERIKKNLGLSEIDVVEFCRNKIVDSECIFTSWEKIGIVK